MTPNIIELHWLSDNALFSINVNCITYFYEDDDEYEIEDGTKIHGTKIYIIGRDFSYTVRESYSRIITLIRSFKE